MIGAIVIYRKEVRPFTDKQIELLANFANQAVIAIENTRLLRELRERTEDLTESLERQTATSEVLKVISSSPGDMKPVFEAILSNALRICEAKFGHLLLYDGDSFEATHLHDVPPSYREYWEEHAPIRPGPNTGLGRLARSKQVAHIPDLKADSAYAEREPLRVVTVEQAGARSFLAVPMLKENKLIGAIVIYRKEVRPFTEKQIELVKNFAAQAVIAIENTRLLRELRESLQQQTATADVLKIISSSPGELEPVFQAMLENATRICEAKFGTLYLGEGDGFRAVAMHNAPPAYKEARAGVVHPSPYTGLWRAAKTKQVVQIADVTLERGYIERDPVSVSAVELGGYRSILCVPMLHEDKLIGVIAIFRQEVRPFTDKQIDLVKNFAAQAVIAIENTRLLSELRESLQQQTATADVLKVISRSTFDLQTVLQTLVESADDYPRPTWAPSPGRRTASSTAPRPSALRANSWTISKRFRSRQIDARPVDALCSRVLRSKFRMYWPIPNIHSPRLKGWAIIEPSSAFRCCAKASQSVFWLSCAPRSARLPASKSSS